MEDTLLLALSCEKAGEALCIVDSLAGLENSRLHSLMIASTGEVEVISRCRLMMVMEEGLSKAQEDFVELLSGVIRHSGAGHSGHGEHGSDFLSPEASEGALADVMKEISSQQLKAGEALSQFPVAVVRQVKTELLIKSIFERKGEYVKRLVENSALSEREGHHILEEIHEEQEKVNRSLSTMLGAAAEMELTTISGR